MKSPIHFLALLCSLAVPPAIAADTSVSADWSLSADGVYVLDHRAGLAWPLFESACAGLREVASFEAAGVATQSV